MIATDTPEKNEIENYKMYKAKVVKKNLVTKVSGIIESNNNNEAVEFEEVDTCSLHNSDTSVGNETFSDSDDEKNLSSVTLDSTKVRHIKRNDFLLVRLLCDASSNKNTGNIDTNAPDRSSRFSI